MRYPSIAALDRSFDDVYISPHLDDVAFSCGGRILRERALGRSVLVVTVFTAEVGPCREISPRVRARVGDMVERRCEDERAMARLGADFLWLDHPEAIFRDRAYHTLYGAFSRFVPADRALAAHLALQIVELVERTRPRRLYSPLGVGQHADHRVVFESVVRSIERLRQSSSTARAPEVCFYEDAPYALIPHLVEHRLREVQARWIGEEVTRGSAWTRARHAYATMMTLDSVRAAVGHWALRAAAYGFLVFRFVRERRGTARARLWLVPELCEIGDVLPAKLEVIAEYRSQIAPVLGDVASYARLRRAYSHRLIADVSTRISSYGSAGASSGSPSDGVFERIWRVVPSW
ncbi:MAG: PIG-L family deacetylase [Blastocatellia bacterium]|nr:PIG-L family deacetylase [Blastocatellia bacterium]MCS7158225.1 PIG-L family deacetylase [Blastocatellia bacterium]MCX7753063.1 PIG-L family deacetylase [Blastocatellia bacterium]MDW8169379.1 PIG-L family deacetylase [Acidobacteriota bacterium]MDW8256446.1 PIG-L family deacetylase [Acidobacteriota bacterium]